VPSIVKSLSVLLVVTLALLVAHAEFTGRRVVIEPFEVSSRLKEHGFTSRAVANKLTDQITRIRSTAKTSMRRQRFVASAAEAAPQVLALGGDLSLDAIFQYLREFFGRDPVRIVGEIVTALDASSGPAGLAVTIRVRGAPALTVSGPVAEFDRLLLESTEHIFLHTQPYVLASYLYEVDPKRCPAVILHILRHEPDTDDARAFNLWGLLASDAGDLPRAVDRFLEAARIGADRDIIARAYTNAASALRRLGKSEAALEAARKAMEADPAYADAYYVRGLVLLGAEPAAPAPGDAPQALEMFRRAVELNPHLTAARLVLADTLERRNDLSGAIAQLRQAVDLDRGSAAVRTRLARALIRAKEMDEARAQLEQAVALDPLSFEALSALGGLLLRQGDLPAAREQFARAQELSPREPSTRFNLGLIYRMSGDRHASVREFQEYLALSPDGPGADQARRFLAELRQGGPVSREAVVKE
jgi:tetratricopeptide (TPR) repeat protein